MTALAAYVKAGRGIVHSTPLQVVVFHRRIAVVAINGDAAYAVGSRAGDIEGVVHTGIIGRRECLVISLDPDIIELETECLAIARAMIEARNQVIIPVRAEYAVERHACIAAP